eukprot:TRINITY_DN5587_c0_g3_i1.p1 TRINITY_DN5587_c0_g3~~TRINITY_DN5587_c0_g3_i1.p1  ORF type:complete len:394 (+),score=59.08 TRINITY_DN5587_c0_g3_i1:69-1250(+)
MNRVQKLFSRTLSTQTQKAVEFSVEHAVIGAGVVGLAIAQRLAREAPTLLVERNSRIGEEISSRNSEVLHAGIYYPKDSWKTKSCIKGRKMMYDVCQRYNIPHKKIGKWIFAKTEDEIEHLHKIKANGDSLDVPLHFIPRSLIKSSEPNLLAIEVLESPETGIVDSHEFMRFLEHRFLENNGDIAFQTPVHSIEPKGTGGYIVQTESCTFEATSIVNSAGLFADKIASMVLKDKMPDSYKLKYCKGHYFGYTGKSLVNRLTYPVPEKNLTGLGVHTTLDLAGHMRLGPDTKYVDDPYDLNVPENLVDNFYEKARRYLPSIQKDKLYPDYAGMRPKLSGPGEGFRDFLIVDENEKGFPGFVNLLGIESPGLTASLAIAELVAKILGYKELDTMP